VDTPKGLFVEARNDAYGLWTGVNHRAGVYLCDRPDPDFNEFVFNRVMGPLATGQPRHDRSAGWVELVGGNLRYIAGLYPFSSSPNAAPDRVLSVVSSDRPQPPACGA
jgi:hypothetical protein